MDLALTDEIAQAWIDACPEEQEALNRFDTLLRALGTLVPDGPIEWTVHDVDERPTVLVLVETGLITVAVEGGERSGAPPAEVVSAFDRVPASIAAVELREGANAGTPWRRWRFHRRERPPLELSSVAPRGHFARPAAGERTERLAAALAGAVGWAEPSIAWVHPP